MKYVFNYNIKHKNLLENKEYVHLSNEIKYIVNKINILSIEKVNILKTIKPTEIIISSLIIPDVTSIIIEYIWAEPNNK